MDVRSASIVTVHLSKLLDLVQVLLDLSQAGEDLAVAWVRIPAKEVQQFQRVLQGTVQCTCGAGLSNRKCTFVKADSARVLRSLWLQGISSFEHLNILAWRQRASLPS